MIIALFGSSRLLRRAAGAAVFFATLLCVSGPLSAEPDYDAADPWLRPTCSRCNDCCGYWCRGTLFRWPGAEPSREDLRPDRIISDQPHIAESAAVVGKGTIQLEMDFFYTSEAAGGTEVDNFSYPNFLLRWGMFCDWFELRLGWSYNEEDAFDPVVGGLQRGGGDDMYVGAKIALAEQHGILPQLAVFPQMLVPTGTNGFSAGEVLPGVNIAYGWQVTDCVGLEVNTQINRASDNLGGFYTEYLQVVNVGWDVHERIMLFSEIVGIWPDVSTVAQPEYLYQGGLQYYPCDNLTIYVHAGAGLNDAADNVFGGIGLAFRTP